MNNNYQGLSLNKVNENQKKYGKNIISDKKKKTLFKIILSQLKDATIYLLLVADVLSILLKEYLDAIIILVVLVLNTIIGTLQEYKAEKALYELKKMTSPKAKVFREGQLNYIDVSELTIDDVVYLEEGDIVPSDMILLETSSLKVDESILTGESLPVEKNEKAQGKEKLNYVFSSTTVVSGNCVGKVVSIGEKTEVGKIALMLKLEEDVTPLKLKLEKMSKFLGIFTIVLAIVIFGVGILLSFDALEILIFSISLAVAAIPEGLPAVVTIVLSLGIKKMVKEKAIVRSLPSVETLGSVEIVCTDKTGTITKNKLEVKEEFSFLDDKDLLYSNFYYCNNVKNNIGDPLEISLIEYLKKVGFLAKNNYSRVKEYPFNSERKMMSIFLGDGKGNILFSKGACEVILNRCKYVVINNKVEELNNNILGKLNSKCLELENKAYRVLGFAYNNIDKEDELIFLGMVGFIDPPRENISSSIELLKKAGIKTIMITGDHKNTAYQIAKEVGIVSSIDQCISGDELDLLIKENKPLDNYLVFSRVNPSHKVNIVSYYKDKNKVVSMTGDGVNDAPSLKKADVGIAMGSGSEVSKSSSDIILLDNNFKTIEKAIEEGRNIYLNIKKSVLFLLSSNLGEVLSVVLFLFLKLPLPLLSIHILWVNLISDSLPALALGNDKKYHDVMNDAPRKKDESIFARKGLFITLFYGVLIFVITSLSYLLLPMINLNSLGLKINLNNIGLMLENETILNKSRTFAFTTLGMSQLFHMIGMSNVKEKVTTILKNKNNIRIIAFIVGIILQVMVTEIPLFIDIFKTTRLELYEWGWLILISMTPLIFHGVLRYTYKTNL